MSNSALPKEAVTVLSQTFHVDGPCPLSVDVPGAHTRLRPASADGQVDVEVSATDCSSDEAGKIRSRLELDTYQQDNTIHVYGASNRSDAEWWRWMRTFDATLHVDLRLPPRIEADVRVPGGAVTVADLQGRVDVAVMGGSCQIENVSGTLDLRAESSDVSIRDVSGGEVAAHIAVGTLTLENVEADTIAVHSVAAPTTLTSVSGSTTVAAKSAPVDLQALSGPCTARVEGGPLHYTGTPDDEMTLQVVGGSLEALLPVDHGADLRMSGPALTLADCFSFDGRQTQHEIKGTLKGGGPTLSLSAIGGSVDCQSA